MKKIIILCLAIMIFVSGCRPNNTASSEQPGSFLSDLADTAQTIVAALSNNSNEKSGSSVSDNSGSTNSHDNSGFESNNTNSSGETPSSANEPDTSSIINGDSQYYNERTNEIYPSTVWFTPIGIYNKRYYKNLDTKTQEAYRIIDNAVYNMQTGYINLGNCSYSQAVLAFDAVRHDRPEYYWIPNAYLCNDNDSSNFQLGIGIASQESTWYLCTKAERNIYDSQIKSALQDLNSKLNSGMSEYEREVVVHDWLVKRVTYDFNVAYEYKTNGTSIQNKFAFSALGALVKNSAVCEGYSRALQLALNYVGIECGLVSGKYNGGNHLWNIVKINNRWYHVDATSDDTSDGGFHTFLNTSTVFILNTHTIDADYSDIDPNNTTCFNFDLPQCNSMDYNYLTIKQQMLSDKSQMDNIVTAALITAANDSKTYCEFGFSTYSPYYFSSDQSSDMYLPKLIDLNYCINRANSYLSTDNQISSVKYSSIIGWKGFILIWEKT